MTTVTGLSQVVRWLRTRIGMKIGTKIGERFLKKFRINSLLKRKRLDLADVQFVLQHTRIVPRKRIDFALRYSYELLHRLKQKKSRKAMIFFVSGHSGDETGSYKKKLLELNRQLAKQYKEKRFFW